MFRNLRLLPVLVLALAGVTRLPATPRPNILLIYTDDHSHRTVSCYEETHPWVRTPNLDALAAGGVRFRHAYIGTWCMPSRATMLTGLHPYGVESMRMEGKYPGSEYDPAKCRFWPAEFRKAGYQTAQIGKWHTGTDTGRGRDWDFQIVWNRPRHPDNSGNYYHDQLITFNDGQTREVKGYSTDNYTRWAQDYLRGKDRDPDKPWYLWLCYGAVHGPYTPAERHLKEYPEAYVRDPADVYGPRPEKPAYLDKTQMWVKGGKGEPVLKSDGKKAAGKQKTLSEWVRQYSQGVLAIDEGVAKLVATLKETGQYENTLIIFTADQGFAWGQHGFRIKLAPYDANLRTPMFMSFPGRIPAGQVCETPVGGADIVPTIHAFAGVPLPWKMHGHDLSPLLRNPAAKWPHPTLLTLTGATYGSECAAELKAGNPEMRGGGVPWWVFVRKGRYKYIRTLADGEMEELYDLEKDPEELTNLALQPQFRATLTEYRAKMFAELRRTDANIADHLPRARTE